MRSLIEHESVHGNSLSGQDVCAHHMLTGGACHLRAVLQRVLHELLHGNGGHSDSEMSIFGSRKLATQHGLGQVA